VAPVGASEAIIDKPTTPTLVSYEQIMSVSPGRLLKSPKPITSQFKPTLPREAASDLRSPAWLLIYASQRKDSGAPAARAALPSHLFRAILAT
jgi:hypothetical protein